MTFLLILILAIVAWIYLMPWLLRRYVNHKVNQYTKQQQRRQPPQPKPSGNKKKIDPTVGEYVDFTEVAETTAHTAADSSTTTTATEQQVTDVTWEDLP